MKEAIIILVLILLIGCKEIEEDCRTYVEIKEEVMCCTKGRTMCWSEGVEISVGDESNMNRIRDYECHPENQTIIHMCLSDFNDNLMNFTWTNSSSTDSKNKGE